VTDANGCTAADTLVITEPPILIAAAYCRYHRLQWRSDHGNGDGHRRNATVFRHGYLQQAAGTHIFTVTDANGCTALDSVTITEPPAVIASATATTILCFGDYATVTVTASGGTPPYSGTGTFSRQAGTHSFTVY
jgi:hypothetical protein